MLSIIKFRDNFPVTKRELRDLHVAKLREELAQAATDLTDDHKFVIMQPASLGAQLDKLYSKLLSPSGDAWQGNIEETYKEVSQHITDYQSVRGRFLSVVNGLAKNCAGYFENQSKNLEILRDASESIKQKAIEPSFELLERTKDELSRVKDEIIKAIEF